MLLVNHLAVVALFLLPGVPFAPGRGAALTAGNSVRRTGRDRA